MIRSEQSGFTLIELVVVIVILGILAAFAVPKFMGLEDQARVSAMQAINGSLQSAATMAHGIAEATNQTGATGTIKVNGANIAMRFGYPAATQTSIGALLQDTSGYTITGAGPLSFAVNGAPTARCAVTYTAARSATVGPVVAYKDATQTNWSTDC